MNVDKNYGITSYDVIRKLKKHLPGKTKIGHLGTLDPMATGVLPVAIGKATRIIPYVQDSTKVYLAGMQLGGISDTQDAMGNIVYTGNTMFTRKELDDTIKGFIGEIEQLPPMYSAVHYEGQRLYELARKGQTVSRLPRKIFIESIIIRDIVFQEGFPLVKLEVACSQGTYVRTLCHDIGQKLGTGAFVKELRRIRSGCFTIEKAVDIQHLDLTSNWENLLLPLDYPIKGLPTVVANKSAADAVCNGRTIDSYNNSLKPGEQVRIKNSEGCLLAIGRIIINGKRQIKPEKVFDN